MNGHNTKWSIKVPENFDLIHEYSDGLRIIAEIEEGQKRANPRLRKIDPDMEMKLLPFREEYFDPTPYIRPFGYQDTNEIFFLDRITLEDGRGGEKIVPVAKGICALYFWPLEEIGCVISSRRKLLFVDACTHTWDGIESVYLITYNIDDDCWVQQCWGDDNFIRGGLEREGISQDEIYSWGNSEVKTCLDVSGKYLSLSASSRNSSRLTFLLEWKDGYWEIETSLAGIHTLEAFGKTPER